MKSTSPLVRYGAFVFSVGGARVVGLLITSFTFPYLVRRLGVEMYGLWSYVVAVCGFLGIVANPGIGVYATQQIAAHRENAFELIPDVLALRFIGSLIACIPLFVIASFEVRPDVRELFHWFGIGILIVNLLKNDYLLTALEMFHANSLLVIIQQGLYGMGILVFVRSSRDILWLPICILGSSFISSLSGWIVLWRSGFRIKLQIQPVRWKGILGPSFHYAISSLMSNLYGRTGHIAVRWFLGEHALGLYAAATRFVETSRHFVSVVLNVLMPRMALAAKTEAGLGRLARFAFAVVTAVSVPMTVGLIATARLIVPWLMGARYLEAIPLLQWMAPFIFTASLASLFSGTILYAMGRHRAYMASTCGGAIAGVLLYIILIEILGLHGASLAYVLAEVIVAGIAFILLPQDLHSLWRSPFVGCALLANLTMLIAIWIVSRYSSNPLTVVTVGACVYLISVFWPFKKWLLMQLGHSS